MNVDWEKVNIYLRPGDTDMRKQINTLSLFVKSDMEKDPLNGDMYIFCGKNRKRIKALYWDRNGFCMWQKQLERDRFPWPKTEEDAKDITREKLHMLLRGIDFFKEHKEIRYAAIS